MLHNFRFSLHFLSAYVSAILFIFMDDFLRYSLLFLVLIIFIAIIFEIHFVDSRESPAFLPFTHLTVTNVIQTKLYIFFLILTSKYSVFILVHNKIIFNKFDFNGTFHVHTALLNDAKPLHVSVLFVYETCFIISFFAPQTLTCKYIYVFFYT